MGNDVAAADSQRRAIMKKRLIMISQVHPGDGVAIFDHEAIHIGCSFRSSLLNGVERQEDDDPKDREYGHVAARCNSDSPGACSPPIRRKHASTLRPYRFLGTHVGKSAHFSDECWECTRIR
jgi:hypothetical protein